MSASTTLDVSRLPTYAFGHRSLMWWATAGMIVIEGMVFAIALVAYFYLRGISQHWPLSASPPDLLFGTLNTFVLLLSGWPNHVAAKAAEREDLPRVRLWMVICLLFGVAFQVVRALEFTALNTHWTLNAYGSIVFALLVLHTVHMITDFIDTAVLAVLMHTGPLSGRRFVDISENADYWWFVIAAWLPIYFTIYLVPRVFP
ncbi:MAG TPA: cytochrome c oxidase subunit 3 [Steroidobacteraceae bacterium]|jgi:heme/copper-type cytochrome/quinol oxidase subunit 3|nr:cytochrome c oxidase subunit 3 [Steroidobacteraceae bacterium]